MPLWLWLVDSLALVVLLGVAQLITLAVRRRWLTRRGGAFEMSVNRNDDASARGGGAGIPAERPLGSTSTETAPAASFSR